MGIVASYRQISEFEYASFKRSPLKAYQLVYGKNTSLSVALQDFAEWAGALHSKTMAIKAEYEKTGLYDRLRDLNFDPSGLSAEDQRLFQEQKLKFEAVQKEHARADWRQFSLDKAWQAIHFLLTGQPEGGNPPLAWAVLGGFTLEDGGRYTRGGSRLRILSPGQVDEIASALTQISAEELLSRASMNEMIAANIYSVSNDEESERENIRAHYEGLQRFYYEAKDNGNGILLELG